MWDKWVSVKHLYTSEIVYAWSIEGINRGEKIASWN